MKIMENKDKLKFYTLEQAKNKHLGKVGTTQT
jgi:hypothetical protein